VWHLLQELSFFALGFFEFVMFFLVVIVSSSRWLVVNEFVVVIIIAVVIASFRVQVILVLGIGQVLLGRRNVCKSRVFLLC
jgi:hypothetical protein